MEMQQIYRLLKLYRFSLVVYRTKYRGTSIKHKYIETLLSYLIMCIFVGYSTHEIKLLQALMIAILKIDRPTLFDCLSRFVLIIYLRHK